MNSNNKGNKHAQNVNDVMKLESVVDGIKITDRKQFNCGVYIPKEKCASRETIYQIKGPPNLLSR